MSKEIKEQKEALGTLVEFNERLVKNMNIIIKELSGERMDDTDIFLKSIIDAMNWEIAVMNGTIGLLNAEEEHINKNDFNHKILAFESAFCNKDDQQMARAIENLIPEFKNLGVVAKMAIEKDE